MDKPIKTQVSVTWAKDHPAFGIGRVSIVSQSSRGYFRWICKDENVDVLKDFASKVLAALDSGEGYAPGWCPDGFDRVGDGGKTTRYTQLPF